MMGITSFTGEIPSEDKESSGLFSPARKIFLSSQSGQESPFD